MLRIEQGERAACNAGDDTTDGARASCAEGGAINACPDSPTTPEGACWRLVDCAAIPLDAPREVVRAVLAPDGGDRGYRELVRSKRHGFCCGAGGGRMFMEEHEGERVNVNRTDEIIATGVEAVAVACPFCNIMLTDGMKQRNVEDKIAVLDIAELVAQSIPDVPVSNLVRKKDRGTE